MSECFVCRLSLFQSMSQVVRAEWQMANRPYYYFSELSKFSNCSSVWTRGLSEYQENLGSGTVYWVLIGQQPPTSLLIGQNTFIHLFPPFHFFPCWSPGLSIITRFKSMKLVRFFIWFLAWFLAFLAWFFAWFLALVMFQHMPGYCACNSGGS